VEKRNEGEEKEMKMSERVKARTRDGERKIRFRRTISNIRQYIVSLL